MLPKLTLKNQVYPSCLIQGPLAGISTLPFRELVWEMSQPAFVCTEMISANTLIQNKPELNKRFLSISEQEGPVSVQLSASDPKQLGIATQIATDSGASIIDLNCGCPVKKIRKKGAGSRLLSDPMQIYHLITAMKANTPLPVTLKIRVQSHFEDPLNDDIIKAVQDAAPDALVVHGRHWTQHYETACQYDQIAYFVNALSIPVIGNGDVACADSLKAMLKTGCAGVMIGRAGVGQPWLIDYLVKSLRNESAERPSLETQGQLFLKHVKGLIILLDDENRAIFQARQFAKYYARNMVNRAEWMEKIMNAVNLNQIETLISQFFK